MEHAALFRVGNLLHVGSGPKPSIPPWLAYEALTSLDIDPRFEPDIVADCRDLSAIADGSFNGVYCAHTLEHLTRGDALQALREFRRVTVKGGLVIVIVPDLEDVRPTLDVIYESECGPVTGADMYWGFAKFLKDYPHMAHRFGYVAETLAVALAEAGFEPHVSRQHGKELLGVGVAS